MKRNSSHKGDFHGICIYKHSILWKTLHKSYKVNSFFIGFWREICDDRPPYGGNVNNVEQYGGKTAGNGHR